MSHQARANRARTSLQILRARRIALVAHQAMPEDRIGRSQPAICRTTCARQRLRTQLPELRKRRRSGASSSRMNCDGALFSSLSSAIDLQVIALVE